MQRHPDKIATVTGNRRQTYRQLVDRVARTASALRALGLPPPLEHPVKLEYMTADFVRSATFLNIDYSLPPGFPALTQHAARAFYLLHSKAPDAAIPFAQAVLRGYFRDRRDISNIDVIVQMVGEQTAILGSSADVRDLLKSDEAKAMLQAAVTDAVEKKVFGSPFVVMDGEGFFGVDRLPQLAARLAGTKT